MTLSNLSKGDVVTIIGYTKTSTSKYRRKLLSMGLTTGQIIRVTRFAPFGDPIEIKIRSFSLTLRKEEADIVLVEKINEKSA